MSQEQQSADVITAVNAIAARLVTLSPVAIEAVALIVERLELGQERYGEPDVYGRDWVTELESEVLDKHAYEGLLLIAHRRRQQKAPLVPRTVTPNGLAVVKIPAAHADVTLTFAIDDTDEQTTSPGVEPQSSFVVDNSGVHEVLR